jgi:hypothetical protein
VNRSNRCCALAREESSSYGGEGEPRLHDLLGACCLVRIVARLGITNVVSLDSALPTD